MNVRVHRAVSDLDGVTGMAIVRAIVAGERDARRLATLRDPRCQQSETAIAEQLSGHWRADHLFSLQQALKMYDTISERLQDYDHEIARQLQAMTPPDRRDGVAPPAPPRKAKKIKARGQEPLRQALYRLAGVDLTTIDAVGVETVSVVVSEYGPALAAFPTEKHFISQDRATYLSPLALGTTLRRRRRRRLRPTLSSRACQSLGPNGEGSGLSTRRRVGVSAGMNIESQTRCPFESWRLKLPLVVQSGVLSQCARAFGNQQ
jgi:hypothetical protein